MTVDLNGVKSMIILSSLGNTRNRDFGKRICKSSAKEVVDEMAKGGFQEVFDDPTAKVTNVDTVVFCSGKFYYEATDKAQELGVNNMAFVRIEQLYAA